MLDDEVTHIKYDNDYLASYEFEKCRISTINEKVIYKE